jgi:hypothetical protein
VVGLDFSYDFEAVHHWHVVVQEEDDLHLILDTNFLETLLACFYSVSSILEKLTSVFKLQLLEHKTQRLQVDELVVRADDVQLNLTLAMSRQKRRG